MAQVEVPPLVAEGLEQLADTLEKELLAQVVKLPDYVPTKYFSQRSMVKALWALKAVVVRDRIYRRPERRLKADLSDLEMLRYFFLLGGPPAPELEVLLKAAANPRERAQLEIIRVESKAFDDALKGLGPSLLKVAEREAAELSLKEELTFAESLSRSWAPAVASALAHSLKEKLVPGPRHPENRATLLRAAEGLVAGLESRIQKGAGPSSQAREAIGLLGSVLDVLELVHRVPELRPPGASAGGGHRRVLSPGLADDGAGRRGLGVRRAAAARGRRRPGREPLGGAHQDHRAQRDGRAARTREGQGVSARAGSSS